MLEILNKRLRDMGEGPRRPSMWSHHNSTDSVQSSNGGSFGYPSPQSLPSGPPTYHRPSVSSHHMSSYGESGQGHHPTSPPYYHQQDPLLEQPMQPYQQLFQQPSGQHYNFNGQASAQQHRYPPQPAAPSQQFAAWGGYSGLSAQDILDEETAVPPDSNLWNAESR